MRFAMLICGVEDEWDNQDAETMRRAMDDIRAWVVRWRDAGNLMPGGEELDSTSTAKTIRPGADGLPVVTDGPYLELKEVVGGIIFLEAADMDAAVAVAATWPSLTGSSSIEVRPVIEN
jgi:hypothetical protein